MREFESIKKMVRIEDAAQQYGLKVTHNGMCCCPFHEEKTASMKLYQKDNNFHCFSCGKHGDVIDLTAKLNDIDLLDAAKLLNSDFGLGILFEKGNKKSSSILTSESSYSNYKKKLKEQQKQSQWLESAFLVLKSYKNVLGDLEQNYRPKSRDAPLHPLFQEALHNKAIVENLCDRLAVGSDEEKHDIYINLQPEIKKFALRLKEIIDLGLHKTRDQDISQKNEMKEVKSYARR